MASYISSHHSGGWRYVFHIPVTLRPLFDGKSAFRKYIKRMPRREAEMIARQYALDDDARLAAHKSLPIPRQQELAGGGGYEAILKDDRRFLPPEEHRRRKMAQALQQKIDRTKPSLVGGVSFDALFAEWVRVKEPLRTRNHAAVISLLKEYFGPVDARKLLPAEVSDFRDHQLKTKSKLSVSVHLKQIRAMYAAAAKEPRSPFHKTENPAKGIEVLGKPPPANKDTDKAFTGEQTRIILETAKVTKWGGKRHTEINWMLRLLAFQGMRIIEASMLQAGDVFEQDGVKVVKVRDTDAITGLPHPLKSVKTETRLIPIHPEVAEFYDYASSFPNKDEFIFGKLKYDRHNKTRGAWLTQNFGKFTKKTCGIIEPNKKLSANSLRHRFHDAMDLAGVPDKIQRRITGHVGGDIHSQYGGNVLSLMADWIANVKPTG
jgi:integrase